MIKYLIITVLTVFTTGIALSQSKIESKIFKAEIAYFDNTDFAAALPLFREIETMATPDHKALGYSKEKIASCLYFLMQASRKEKKSEKSVALAEEFITYLAHNKEHIKDAAILEKRFIVSQQLIVHYNQQNTPALARPHQEQLYVAFYTKQLPKAISTSYQLDEFECMGNKVKVYESYEQVHNKQGGKAFDKHMFEVYAANRPESALLFTLQTERLMSSERGAVKDFVLTKREGDGVFQTSQAYWDHTFRAPSDYRDVKQAVFAVLTDMNAARRDHVAENKQGW